LLTSYSDSNCGTFVDFLLGISFEQKVKPIMAIDIISLKKIFSEINQFEDFHLIQVL